MRRRDKEIWRIEIGMKIFVTGATGYLGYHFVNVAVSQGHEILCLRRPTSKSLFDPIVEKQIQWVKNDDEAKLRETVNAFQPDVLFHAAWGGVRGDGRENERIQQENIELSKKLFALYPYKQIVALGSQAEYGYYQGPIQEDVELQPENWYGIAKVQTSKMLQNYCEMNNLEWQWIRIFTVFGEKQTGGLIKLVTAKCLAGNTEFDTTEGRQKYSFLYTTDFAKALCCVLGANGKSGIYNLSQPADVYSNREILQKIKEELRSDICFNFGAMPYPKHQVMYMDGDVEKFENAFGPIPHTDFNEALRRTIASIKDDYMKG